jgi:hypothetical protein
VYIYVYQNRATIYLGREEIAGPGTEDNPKFVGALLLDSITGFLPAGDIGFRIWSGGVAEIDYMIIYSNDSDNDPTSFPEEAP